jgi:DNA mismatch endonuclease (patch repair protein)
MAVRRLLHGMGYRFRLQRKDLPGRPDIAFPSRKKVVFVHGCFWHGHGCAKGRLPKSRPEYWAPKIVANRDRDSRAVAMLDELGWRSLIIWQCETNDLSVLERRLGDFLGLPGVRGGVDG